MNILSVWGSSTFSQTSDKSCLQLMLNFKWTRLKRGNLWAIKRYMLYQISTAFCHLFGLIKGKRGFVLLLDEANNPRNEFSNSRSELKQRHVSPSQLVVRKRWIQRREIARDCTVSETSYWTWRCQVLTQERSSIWGMHSFMYTYTCTVCLF